jgi:uncharacterized protein YecT (DUF1311 family)
MTRLTLATLAPGLAPALALALALPATAALADSACNHPGNDFDGLYCLNKIYQQADHDLNAAFAQLRAKLDEPGRAALKSGQLSWMHTRNDQCSRHEDGNFYVNLNCATNTTIARTQFLQDRYRECISAGCLASKLQ